MSFRRYESYEDSGVEWFGELPAHWIIQRLKTDVELVTEKATDRQRPIALENIESWSGRLIVTDTDFEGDGVVFKSGDLLFGKLRPYLAKVHLAESAGEAVGDFHVLRPSGRIESRYFLYFLLNQTIISVIDGATIGAKMPRASWDFMANLQMLRPPLSEQASIAAFLDRETAKIDALIGDQKQLIELLKEKRQAVISHAVTKGLDPNAPMKNSGVEWLGEVPAHWETRKLGSSSRLQSGYAFSSSDFSEEGVPVVRMTNLNRGVLDLDQAKCIPESSCEPKVEVRSGDLLWGMSGSVGDSGSLGNFAIAKHVDLPCQINQRVGRFVSNDRLLITRYLTNIIQANCFYEQILLAATGTAQYNISPDQVHSCIIALPPISEQQEIVDFLNEHLEKLDNLIRGAEGGISLLQERRSALIFAAVTGKIDVRSLTVASEEA